MLAVVKAPRTQSTEAAEFKIEGTIPNWLLTLIKGMFDRKEVIIDDSDECINVDNCKELQEWNQKMTSGDCVKADRKLRGWTQKTLAQKLGISVQNLSHIENGRRNVSKKMATKLADVFETSPDFYLKNSV